MKISMNRLSVPIGVGSVRVYATGCWHFDRADAGGFDEKVIEEMVSEIEKDKYGMSLITGDVVNNDRATDRKARRLIEVENDDVVREMSNDDKCHADWLDEHVIPYILRLKKAGYGCLGMLEGNHYRMYGNGMTSTQYICFKAGIKYLGNGVAYIRLIFETKVNKKTNKYSASVAFNILAYHGEGNKISIGSDSLQMEKVFEYFRDVHLVIGGHTHKKYGVPGIGLKVNRCGELVEIPVGVMRSGSAQKSYVVNATTYGEKKLFKPVKRGWTMAEIFVGRRNASGSSHGGTYMIKDLKITS